MGAALKHCNLHVASRLIAMGRCPAGSVLINNRHYRLVEAAVLYGGVAFAYFLIEVYLLTVPKVRQLFWLVAPLTSLCACLGMAGEPRTSCAPVRDGTTVACVLYMGL